MRKTQTKKVKNIYILPELIDKIVVAKDINEKEKMQYFRFLGYLTKKEQQEFLTLL